MKPENMSWFADTFLNMLLFYGCSDRRTVKMAIDGQNGTDSSSVLQQKNFLVDSSAKKTFLEDRMRDTRNFPSGNNARIHSASKAYGSYSSPDLHVPYQQLSTEFEGNENFFFHFVVLLNNFHFNYCLTNVILREIFATSNRVEYAAKEFTARSEVGI